MNDDRLVLFDVAMQSIGYCDYSADGLFKHFKDHMNNGGRVYHNFDHTWDVFTKVVRKATQMLRVGETQGKSLIIAALLHDYFYTPGAKDNEEQSCLVVEYHFPTLDREVRQEARRLIRLTKTHEVEEGDSVGELLVWADLSILASTGQRYAEYVSQIKAEYDISEAEWVAGRAAWLQRMLDRESIFPKHQRPVFEGVARWNMENELWGLLPELKKAVVNQG